MTKEKSITGGGIYIELKRLKKSFVLTASVRGLGLKHIGSNVHLMMGNTWERLGFIRNAK